MRLCNYKPDEEGFYQHIKATGLQFTVKVMGGKDVSRIWVVLAPTHGWEIEDEDDAWVLLAEVPSDTPFHVHALAKLIWLWFPDTGRSLSAEDVASYSLPHLMDEAQRDDRDIDSAKSRLFANALTSTPPITSHVDWLTG